MRIPVSYTHLDVYKRQVRMCHGTPEAGYSDSFDETDVSYGIFEIRMGLHVCSNLPGCRMAIRCIHDEAVLREYSDLSSGSLPD